MASLSSPADDIPPGRVDDEEQSEQDVADVGVDVIEIRQLAQRVSAKEVEVAQVLVACIVEHLRTNMNCHQDQWRGIHLFVA